MRENQTDEPEQVRVPLPNKRNNEMFAVVEKRLGGSRMHVSCADGKLRMARIPGSRRRRIKRIRVGDLVIIAPWEVQDEKADVKYKYRMNQARILSNRHLLPEVLDVF